VLQTRKLTVTVQLGSIPRQVVYHSKKNQTNICSSAAMNCKSTTFAVTEYANIMFLSTVLCELQAVKS